MSGLTRLREVLDAHAHGTLVLGVVVAVLVVVVTLWASRHGWSGLRTLGAVLAAAGLGLVLTVTALQSTPFLPIGIGQACRFEAGLAVQTPTAQMNLLLYVPLAVFGTLALRRALPVGAGLVLLAVSMQAVQMVLAGGGCQTTQLVHNVGGIVIGVLAGAALTGLFGTSQVSARRPVVRV